MTRRSALKGASISKPAAKTKATTQTVRINGVRTIITTRDGKVTTKAALPLEWELQAAQVRALRRLPEYIHTAKDVRPGTFTLAGDQNAAKRGTKARAEALAAGLTPEKQTSGSISTEVYCGRLKTRSARPSSNQAR